MSVNTAKIISVLCSAASSGPEGIQNRAVEALNRALIHSWCMKPIKDREQLRTGLRNEGHAQSDLARFWQKDTGGKIEALNTLGLMATCKSPLEEHGFEATSVDGICSVRGRDEAEDAEPAVIEHKCFLADDKLTAAMRIRTELGSVHRVDEIVLGTEDQLEWATQFKKSIPDCSHRIQCLHHCAVLGLSRILCCLCSKPYNIYYRHSLLHGY